ncbi:glycosyltransferase [Evansella tamaricis]|uniref:Glycosyltransferase n=1 Tax=Evansella tamaricis TaxID=2069301 RepID=A0ABS6JM37_9BACI|nr:glycosyltransferase [Evansella tamaricis]MBU9713495.1 glycosyltransferase [Evansella tamaricis]
MPIRTSKSVSHNIDELEDHTLPTLTVGIPFHNGSNVNHLKTAIDSIIEQSLSPDVIHLLQDGPVSDLHTELIGEYKKKVPNVIHLKTEKNSGLPTILNLSILNSNTKYYARMDGDDISVNDRLLKQIGFLEKHQNVGIVGTWAYEFKEDITNELFLKRMPVENAEMKKFFHYRSPFIHPSVIFRREIFSKIGIYNTEFYTSQDTELWARALKKGIIVANINEPLIYYRSVNVEKKRGSWKSVCRIAKAQFSYNTLSPMHNLLKIGSIVFRLLPNLVKKWCYDKLRD